MILDLPDDIINQILKKLYNYDLFNIVASCKKMRILINDPSFINYILHRYHPLVFNSDDLYCHKCNLHIYRINCIKEMDNIWCRH